ncbi:hypothetical protein VTN77DRAFT_6793 [Rasamsonia byssochlamydoides]|uniref:uncharacterized protein n=1 Tax=Rasamsonia byssochlamydoides TaxID=89139 RepID=UPI003742D407
MEKVTAQHNHRTIRQSTASGSVAVWKRPQTLNKNINVLTLVSPVPRGSSNFPDRLIPTVSSVQRLESSMEIRRPEATTKYTRGNFYCAPSCKETCTCPDSRTERMCSIGKYGPFLLHGPLELPMLQSEWTVRNLRQ